MSENSNVNFDISAVGKKGLKRFYNVSKKMRQDVQNEETEEPVHQNEPPEKTHSLFEEKIQISDSEKLESIKKDYERIKNYMAPLEEASGLDGLEQFEPISEVLNATTSMPDALYIYDNYNFEHEYDPSLPVYQYREKILNTIEAYPACVISGSTGSGKTTVIPQFIIDSYAAERKYCNIVITQPRRVAAITTATRVANERSWPIGSVVGYSVSLKKCASEDTRLHYVTTGVLLQCLVTNPETVNTYTHIIIDEVHERTEEIDLCLLVLKNALKDGTKTKIILMSATIETSLFTNYLASEIDNHLIPAPVVEVFGRQYEVQQYYIDNIPFVEPCYSENQNPGLTDATLKTCYQIIENLSNFDLNFSQPEDGEEESFKSVLIFLPGVNEIHDVQNWLKPLAIQNKLSLLTLHSKLSPDEQVAIFRKPKPGCRKIILATNIAESSITVPDIGYVIDFCLQKYVVWDKKTNLCHLQMSWTSISSAEQRKGRAGRIDNGICFRLVTQAEFENFEQFNIPDIKRKPLEFAILNIKKFFSGPPILMLHLLIDPPVCYDVNRSILNLKEIGAITITKDRKFDPNDGEITFLGEIIRQLPLDLRYSKLIALGYIFGMMNECIIIAACLSLQCVFTTPLQKELESFISKKSFSRGSNSDLIAYYMAYKTYKTHIQNSNFNQTRQWGRDNFINVKKLEEVDKLVKDIKEKLSKINILDNIDTKHDIILNEDDMLLMKILIAGAFYPNYFVSNNIDLVTANRNTKMDTLSTVSLPNPSKFGKNASINNFIFKSFNVCGPIEGIFVTNSSVKIKFNTHKEEDEIDPAVSFALYYKKLSKAAYRRIELEQNIGLPTNPLLVEFRSICHEIGKRKLVVSYMSLNSVFCNYHTNVNASNLLVAGEVTISGRNDQIIAGETTIFPTSVGLLELLIVLFCPFALFRCDLHRKRYIQVLCGLGYHPQTKEALFPENDIEFVFPFKFTADDLDQVNIVRTFISYTLGRSIKESNSTKTYIKSWRDKVISKLIDYIKTERSEVSQITSLTYSWAFENYLPETFDNSDFIFKAHLQTL